MTRQETKTKKTDSPTEKAHPKDVMLDSIDYNLTPDEIIELRKKVFLVVDARLDDIRLELIDNAYDYLTNEYDYSDEQLEYIRDYMTDEDILRLKR